MLSVFNIHCISWSALLTITILGAILFRFVDLHGLQYLLLSKLDLIEVSFTFIGAVVAQLASARLSEREVPSSIFSDFNVCFDFPLIRVAIALNTRKMEH